MQYCIILWRKMYDFFMKIYKLLAKKSFRSLILRKSPVRSKQILVSWETIFPFLNNFQILHTASNSMKELWKSIIFKNNLNFLIKWGFVPPPHLLNFFKIILIYYPILMKFRMKYLYLIVSCKIRTLLKVFTNGSPLPPPPPLKS